MITLPDHIHVTGGSGAGTTTLGAAIAGRHGHRHLDPDDFFWERTDPPFTTIRPQEERLALLRAEFHACDRWVLSGAIGPWGYELTDRFDLVIWLARLKARERNEFGARIEPGGDMCEGYEEFIRWAASYDSADGSQRSFVRHSEWTASLSCPVIRVEGAPEAEETLRFVERERDRR